MDAKRELINILQQQKVNYWNNAHTHIVIRCRYCGDSVKDPNHAHMFVKVDKEPFVYYCQRCGKGGFVLKSFLQELDVYNSELSFALKRSSKKGYNKFNKQLKRYNLNIPKNYEPTKINRFKLDYINSRIGMNLGFKDLHKYKIVLNLFDLLDMNKLPIYNDNERFVETLNKNFMGFLSYDGSHLIMRNLSKRTMTNLRYYNYNIFNLMDGMGSKIYLKPNPIDFMSLKPINVHIAEGVFDIMGVSNMNGNIDEHTMYIANNGAGFLNSIRFLVSLGVIDFKLNLYGDRDRSVSYFKDLKPNIKCYSPHFNLFYNVAKGEKDFGVPLDKINKRKILL